jgi:hypothetical protein
VAYRFVSIGATDQPDISKLIDQQVAAFRPATQYDVKSYNTEYRFRLIFMPLQVI